MEINRLGNGTENPDPVESIAALDPRSGLTTWAALYHFVDAELAANVYRSHEKYFGPGGNYLDQDWRDPMFEYRLGTGAYKLRRLQLERALHEMLCKGDLIGRGFLASDPLDAERRIVAADRWIGLALDVRASTASGIGQTILNILVFDPQLAEKKKNPGRSSSYSPAAVRRWYARRIEEYWKSGRIPTRADDYVDVNRAKLGAVPRDVVRDLRKELAPAEWKRHGRRPRDDGSNSG